MPGPTRHRPVASQAKRLASIQARLAAFRRNHHLRARIPDSIRREVLELLADGVSPGEILRTCKISNSLLYSWRHRSEDTEKSPRPVASILSVIDPEVAPVAAPARHADLKFSIGGWNLHLRLEPVDA
jgi:hypothetical protein